MSNIIVKSDNKFYFRITEPSWLGYSSYKCLIDGNEPVKSPFNNKWFVSDKKPENITLLKNEREYTDWSIKEDYEHLNLPKTVDKFETDDEGDFPSESMFYTHNFVEKEVEDTKEVVWNQFIEEKVGEPVAFSAVGDSSYGNDKIIKITPTSALVDSLLHPDIVLPSKACALTGDQLYKIVRHHIKNNIDTRYAKVTSDYNFCFTVKKLLSVTPVTHSYDARTGRQKRPRIKTYTVTDREVDVFEMTPPSEKATGYTPIGGLKADTHQELKAKLDNMLDGLMQEINKPVESCKSCGGTGAVEPKKVSV